MSTYMTPALERWRRLTDAPLLILAIGSLPPLLLELARHDLARGDRLFLDVVNVVDAHLAYLEAIGAVGPRADDPGAST